MSGSSADPGQGPPHASTDLRATKPGAPRHASFEIYRTERVSLTSIFFSGDDWRWRLLAGDGTILVNSQEYKTERACRAAVLALRDLAGTADIPEGVEA